MIKEILGTGNAGVFYFTATCGLTAGFGGEGGERGGGVRVLIPEADF